MKKSICAILILTYIFLPAILILACYMVITNKPDRAATDAAERAPSPIVVSLPVENQSPAESLETAAIEDEDLGPENELIEKALLAMSNRIDNCTVTWYCPCERCCGKWTDGVTASGVEPWPGETVAVDPSVIPLGASVFVDFGDGDLQYYKAEDTGVRGRHIDVYTENHQEAINNGKAVATVYWLVE